MSPPTRRRTATLAALLSAGALVILAFVVFKRQPPNPSPDAAAALAAHNRGVGLMEQFDYAGAATAFEEATRADPAGRTDRINLAIALLNTAVDPNLDRA